MARGKINGCDNIPDVILPDFRNLGVLLRCGVLAEMARFLFVAMSMEGGWSDLLALIVAGGGGYEAILLSSLLVLYLFAIRLRELPYRSGVWASVALVFLVAQLWFLAFGDTFSTSWWRFSLVVLGVSVMIIWYFNWRHRVLSPTLSEARLMALQARIRPHFLFNSLNTVLGLLRTEPKQAERVLEGLADLYRALLSESGSLVRLDRELALARSYADIERMRLGPRLVFNWQCQAAPPDALVPPLMLQPLIENAVYHGIEPSETGGTVSVTIFLKDQQLQLVVRNPCHSQAQKRTGNRIALTNIRERLALHFDAEAEMSAYQAGGEFVVQIRLPYRHG